jgi:hypothetical protein
MKCDTCEHKEVCGKKEAYKATFDKINVDAGEFEIELKCKHYKEQLEQYRTYLEQQKTILNPITPWKDGTKPYIGDIVPNPWEITCK